jgi:hypothetical protein
MICEIAFLLFAALTAQMKNNRGAIQSISGRVRMEEYVKGPEPDRWHWCKNCAQYPRVALKRRSHRPDSDLCDECQSREAKKTCVIT